LSADSKGWRITFRNVDGKPCWLRLGKVPKRVAETVKRRVEELLAVKIMGCPPPRETAAWVASTSNKLRSKLAKVGLVDVAPTVTVQKLAEEYLALREDLSKSSKNLYKLATTKLISFFGPNKVIAKITEGDATDFKHVLETKVAPNTWKKVISVNKQIFSYACRKGYLSHNPFGHLRGLAIKPNTATETYIPISSVKKVLDVMPLNWKAVFCLARLNALRCPSEIATLRWQDIDWEKNVLRVRCVKTERTGAAVRIVPLFETRQFLAELFDAAPAGAVYVFPELVNHTRLQRDLGHKLKRYFELCGLPAPPRPWQNARRSAVIDMAMRFPMFAVNRWAGHSLGISEQHYLRTTEELLQQAAQLQRLSPETNTAEQYKESGNVGGNASDRNEAHEQESTN
jgi:integrase